MSTKEIVMALRELGVPADLLGYEYLKCAIGLCLDDRSYIQMLTKRLYPAIAERFGTTPTRVERAIRHAIEVCWGRGNVATLNRYFGYTINLKKDRSTNGEFIATVVEQLRLEQETAG